MGSTGGEKAMSASELHYHESRPGPIPTMED